MTAHQPNDIKASRVFLADFDRVTYSQIAWLDEEVDELIRNYERKVKLLLLVKGHMLIPLTHLLEFELARQSWGTCRSCSRAERFIPFYGTVDTARQLLISGLEVAGMERVVKRVSCRVQTGVAAAGHWADRRDFADRPILLSFVDQMKRRYADMLDV